MTPLELPDGVRPREMHWALVDYGGWQRGGLGGPATRIDRLGSHYRIRFVLPPLPEPLGRRTVSRLIRAQRLGMRVALPLIGFDPGLPGAPVVDGNGQSGTSLAVAGFHASYGVREGQWVTHVRGDDRLLYNSAANVEANGAGEATVTLEPMLRMEPVDGDELLFARPEIQGLVTGEERAWRASINRTVEIEFEVEEVI
jgi:hypothetical protein